MLYDDRNVWIVLGALVIACLSVWMIPMARAGDAALEMTQRLIRSQFPDVPQVSTAELAAWLERDRASAPILLDVREADEYSVSHLAGAQRASDLQSALALLADRPKEGPVVLYCSVGYRSSSLARALLANGYQSVSNLEGSIFAWANEGRPVYREGQQVRQVHPYNWIWGRLLEPDLRSR